MDETKKNMQIPLQEKINHIKLILRLGFTRITFKKLYKTIKYLFLKVIRKKDIPGAVIIAVTSRCQCKCPHCSVGYKQSDKTDIDIEKCIQLIDDIADYGIPKINLFGGEPLLLGNDIIKLVKHASDKGLSVSIDTNAVDSSKDLINNLSNAGINNINISIDSADEKKHDSLRGITGTFANAVECIKNCVEMKIPCVLSTYASKENIANGDLQNIIALGKSLKVTGIKIMLPLLSGKWAKAEEVLLNKNERQYVFNLIGDGLCYIESPVFSIKNGKKICEALNKNMIYISATGDLQPCYTVPVSFGNVFETKLPIILNKMWQSDFFKGIDNEYDCIMNNPLFRDKYLNTIQNAKNLPLFCEKVKP